MNAAEDKNSRRGPHTLYEVLHADGEEDPQAPHLAEILLHCDQTPDSAEWLLPTLAGMAGEIAELRRSPQHGRRDIRQRLTRIVATVQSLIDDTDHDGVLLLNSVASLQPRVIDHAAGFEYLTQLKAWAERCLAVIRVGGGSDTLQDALGDPSAHLLCAACILEIWRALRLPRRQDNEDAQAACRALWLAAGGQDDCAPSHNIRVARSRDTAAISARRTARLHINAMRHSAK